MWSVLSLCMLVLAVSQALETTTNGTSGEQCPRRRCLNGIADCVNKDTCVCRPPKTLDVNNGHFGCYRTNNVFGEIYNDPKVRNYNNETAEFPFPCRYLLTSVTTNLRIRRKDVGNCRCDLHAFNLKHKGKLYVGGLDFACRVTNNVLFKQIGFSARIVGIAHDGVYTYSEEGVHEYKPDGPWTTDRVDITGAGIHVSSRYDVINNQAKFEIPECGWAVTFLAYDDRKRLEQEQIPGISFGINCALSPFFHEHDRVISTAPSRFGGSTYAKLAVPPLTISETLVIRAFTAGVVQNHPGAPSQCTSIGDILKQCPKPNLNQIAKGCFWMPTEPRFSRCLDPANNTEPMMELYKGCTGVHCAGEPSCDDFKNDVAATGCSTVENIPELTDINNGNFCT